MNVEQHEIRARHPLGPFERLGARGSGLHRIAVVAEEDGHRLRLDRIILDYED